LNSYYFITGHSKIITIETGWKKMLPQQTLFLALNQDKPLNCYYFTTGCGKQDGKSAAPAGIIFSPNTRINH
jgi:hypothetical protein